MNYLETLERRVRSLKSNTNSPTDPIYRTNPIILNPDTGIQVRWLSIRNGQDVFTPGVYLETNVTIKGHTSEIQKMLLTHVHQTAGNLRPVSNFGGYDWIDSFQIVTMRYGGNNFQGGMIFEMEPTSHNVLEDMLRAANNDPSALQKIMSKIRIFKLP